jgi:hypothetical protein
MSRREPSACRCARGSRYSCRAVVSRSSVPVWTSTLAVAFVLAILGAASTSTALADVCSGGAPYPASGWAPGLGTVVPFLNSPRSSQETLPQWSQTHVVGEWGNQLAYARYPTATIWASTDAAAWWVIPGLGCTLPEGAGETFPQEGVPYEPQVCVLIYAQLALVGFDCQSRKQLSAPNAPVSVVRGQERLVAGFAPPGAGSVEVRFQNSAATLPAVGGVYGGSVSARLGAVVSATDSPLIVARAPTAVALVDQTGLFSASQGALAGMPRLKKVAAQIHARIRSVSASILGTAVKGRRARDEVLYGPNARGLAISVARALHAGGPSALNDGALQMFGSVARVVVLVGRVD